MREYLHDLIGRRRRAIVGVHAGRPAATGPPPRTSRLVRLVRLAALLTLLPWSAAAQLTPAVQADLYLVQTEAYVKEENYAAAKEAMDKIIALSKEHDLALPDEFHFKYAQVLDLAGAHAEVVASLTHYLELTGTTGQHYREALELLHQAMQAESAADHAAFEKARSAGTATAYGIYLRSYPEGRHTTEARRLQAAAQRAQAAKADDDAFRRARSAGTADAYGIYLRSYPNGRHAAEAQRLRDLAPGRQFRDCPQCPLMVRIPAGRYLMGSRGEDEGPQHPVTIREPFAVGVYEVTFAEWDACVRDGGCAEQPDDNGWGRGNRPVIYVWWHYAQAYVRWLSWKTGEEYRLLSESEWEYVARAGTTTPFHTGKTISTEQANYNGDRVAPYRGQTVPVGSFGANEFGLHDVHGNVAEWTQDCWNRSYRGAPVDGTAWERDCGRRVVRGGSWRAWSSQIRSAWRGAGNSREAGPDSGFRVARTLTR